MAVVRPNPLWWLYFQYGGRLPARYRDWVLHDGTSRRWLLRAFVRVLMQAAPFVAVLLVAFALFGVQWYFGLACVVLGVIVSIYYSLSYSVETVNGRLTRYGYPPRYGTTVREQAYDAEHVADAERYQQVWRPEPEE
jgi:hypothetical protein